MAELERLQAFDLLPSPPEVDATTMILVVKSGRLTCVGSRAIARMKGCGCGKFRETPTGNCRRVRRG